MNDGQPETVTEMPAEDLKLDDALRAVWEKVRSAVLLIHQLRDEKSLLASRVTELERAIAGAGNDLMAKEQDLKRLRGEYASLASAGSDSGLTREERENLKERMRELISRINSHL